MTCQPISRTPAIKKYAYLILCFQVTSYRTETTGITPSILKLGLDFHKVKEDVCSIIRGRVLVGHRVERGLKHFGLCHPKWNIRDLTEYDVFDQVADLSNKVVVMVICPRKVFICDL